MVGPCCLVSRSCVFHMIHMGYVSAMGHYAASGVHRSRDEIRVVSILVLFPCPSPLRRFVASLRRRRILPLFYHRRAPIVVCRILVVIEPREKQGSAEANK